MKLSLSPTNPKGFLFRLTGTLLTMGLLIYLIEQQEWSEIVTTLIGIPAWRVGLAFLLMLISRLAVTSRWHVLLRSAGVPIPFRQSARLTFSGLFASNFLPTTVGGDVFRLAGGIQLRLNSAVCAASLVADRLVGIAGMALALPLSLPAVLEWRRQPPHSFSLIWLQGMITFRFGWLSRVFRRFGNFLEEILYTMRHWLAHPFSLLYALMWSWVHMVCLFAAISLILDGIRDPLPFWRIAGLWSLVYFITLLPISINGYGLQELAMTLTFGHSGGISLQSSLTVALVIRLLTMLASLPGALFVPGILSGKQPVLSGEQVEE
ncbi:MAG: lysylphosphatidylglycerol synthase transmembrane domain-containing protein [Chloroflexota bacterium]